MKDFFDNNKYVLLEREIRKKHRKKFFVVEIFLFIVFIFSVYAAVNMYEAEPDTFILCVFIPFFILLAIALFFSTFNSDCVKELKSKLYGDYIEYSFPELKRVKSGGEILSSDLLVLSSLIEPFKRKIEDDAFEGVYKDISYKIVNLIVKVRAGKNGSGEATAFEGLCLQMDFPFLFEGTTLIQPKGTYFFNKISTLFLGGLIFLIAIVYGLICLFAVVPDFVGSSSDIGGALFSFVMVAIFLILSICIIKSALSDNVRKMDLGFSDLRNKYEVIFQGADRGEELISSDLLNKLEQFKKIFKTNKIKVSFFREHIFLSASVRRNLFEIGNLFSENKGIENFKEASSDILTVIDFVKYMADDEGIRKYNK